MPKILHIFNFEEKFSKPFFQFLQDNDFDLKQHQLFHYGKYNPEYKKFDMKFTFARYYSVIKHIRLLSDMFKSKQIIVHSLASPWLLLYLFLFPSLTKKVYWVIWGKDLYFFKLLKKKHFYHHIYEYFRKKVFKNIKHIVTYVKGDYELANRWYGTNAKYHECLMYPSNLYKNHPTIQDVKGQSITIQIGNSADPSNNHDEIFRKLEPFKEEDIQIIAPLSYGNKEYAEKVMQRGKLIFGDKFTPLTCFISFNQYLKILNKIDIAIFAHDRQQAMGNIITLLGMGKYVYLKNNVSSYKLFADIGIKVYDFYSEFTFELKEDLKNSNPIKVAEYFSFFKLKKQWSLIFYEK
ncbi:TDP-N-acetylfucosamine:lipid II N-acetylfucosaminyltransferase [Marinicella gelatinilytica]|uniref:TDP-N-acetylfucosamine:lipid II N-acetylfucosaminyltransferase n=1 Tax=Marinicella gelatinilytica TaxID=2996017 RepID=UPI0022608AC4|nr:TDP-N-acetylfucosamine:lipid II N-acetylfucosaminyltransferase [Marinicella gelatinilytica]MCX7544500.1 TDP-N-acetylfucosamine:lipid II N-acetylfucosaminyltransferase [Marinicella gelatinilytica]